MAMEFRLEGWPSTHGSIRALRSVDRVDADEIVRWASFLCAASGASGDGDQPSACRDNAVRALTEAADHDQELLRRAWLVSLRRLRDGDTTWRAVHLTKAALEEAALEELAR